MAPPWLYRFLTPTKNVWIRNDTKNLIYIACNARVHARLIFIPDTFVWYDNKSRGNEWQLIPSNTTVRSANACILSEKSIYFGTLKMQEKWPMRNHPDYNHNFASFKNIMLYSALNPQQQDFIRSIAFKHRFSFQEFRRIVEVTRDLAMWQEGDLA